MNEQQYFDTLAQAVDTAIFGRTSDSRVLLADPGAAQTELGREHLGYGETRRGSFRIELLRDRRTKQFFHVIITRLDNGRYELVTYVL